ncbi:MAG: UDP-3-O-acyl-N-acetylglucosamine deacetylase [Deltaproteobacteria bacterium]|nr:UDP-3-O-acyl-N-acetylglucosamine deacetylase [Deltaproteobacteria bacterium]MBN2673777.1 UDP-3-O-acyl-N-acetylglucosamine deacetylase [Deltaproteobacteria bacterium]
MTYPSFSFVGPGIHTGIRSQIRVVFRDDLSPTIFHTPNGVVPAIAENIRPGSTRATDIKKDAAQVQTVEHLLFAIYFFSPGAQVFIEGPEVPIMDGSAFPFMAEFQKQAQVRKPNFFRLDEPMELHLSQSIAQVTPCEGGEQPIYTVQLEYEDIPIGPPLCSFSPGQSSPMELAPARTFAIESEIASLRQASKALGGTLDNALVIGKNGPLNKDGMIFSNEPARHKMLDLIGDLSLIGALPLAHIRITRPGHRINHQLCNQLAKICRANIASFPHT